MKHVITFFPGFKKSAFDETNGIFVKLLAPNLAIFSDCTFGDALKIHDA